ncbi:MAG: hypothetical protein Q4F98_08680 [Lachnospiraceae bacterium]|nr:hypothetical protein [Lachnospiraceae bacterium]
MKKQLCKTLRTVLISWGILLLILFPWLGGKYPVVQADLLFGLKIYLALVVIYILASILSQSRRLR